MLPFSKLVIYTILCSLTFVLIYVFFSCQTSVSKMVGGTKKMISTTLVLRRLIGEEIFKMYYLPLEACSLDKLEVTSFPDLSCIPRRILPYGKIQF